MRHISDGQMISDGQSVSATLRQTDSAFRQTGGFTGEEGQAELCLQCRIRASQEKRE